MDLYKLAIVITIVMMAIFCFAAGFGAGAGSSHIELVKVKLLYNNVSSACNRLIDTANQCFRIVGVSQITTKLDYFEEVTP